MTDACRCELSVREVVEWAGAYGADASGGVVTVGAGDDALEYDYCVSEDGGLRLRERSGQADLGVQHLAPL